MTRDTYLTKSTNSVTFFKNRSYDTHYPTEEYEMQRYVCEVCGYIYDPEEGDPDSDIEAGTSFEALPEDWVCPMCGASKEEFSPEEE